MLERSEKGKKRKRKQSEIRLFTSTIQMSQESSRTDPYSLIFGHIKVLHFLTVFLWFKLISNIYSNIKKKAGLTAGCCCCCCNSNSFANFGFFRRPPGRREIINYFPPASRPAGNHQLFFCRPPRPAGNH